MITTALLSAGQALWKRAAINFPVYIKEGSPLFKAVLQVLLSGYFISGAILYVVATLIYLWLFSKYPYFSVQLTMVSLAVVFSLLVSYFIFKEHISIVNFFGIPLILAGVILVTWKS